MNFLMPLLQKLFVWVGTKILIALGVSIISYTGIKISLDKLRDYLSSSINNLPSDVFNLLMMAGLGQAIGIIFGAFTMKAALSSVSKLQAGIMKKM